MGQNDRCCGGKEKGGVLREYRVVLKWTEDGARKGGKNEKGESREECVKDGKRGVAQMCG